MGGKVTMRTLPHNFQDGSEEAPTGLAPSLTPDTLVSLSLSLWFFFVLSGFWSVERTLRPRLFLTL